jgi:putative ABC transport system substrate-binding protein
MRRRKFIKLIGGVAAAWPMTARAQQPIPVIGFVHSGLANLQRRQVAAFQRALSEAGYKDGQNVAIEYRWAQDHFEQVPSLLADLTRRQVNVIFAGGGTALMAKAQSSSIPIVFTSGVDPVQQGLVTSLSRPGGNITGVAFFSTSMGPKQLELLREVVPSAGLIGFVKNPGYPYAEIRVEELGAAARALGLKLVVENIATRAEVSGAFAALREQSVGAIIVSSDPQFYEWREELVAAAALHAIPACYGLREFATAGGLMSYGADLPDAYHQAGEYVARILKGAKAGDLPVVQAVKIELVINFKTAKALGISIPLPLAGRADEVIE